MSKTKAQSQQLLLDACHRLINVLEVNGPTAISKFLWERILEHGSNLFDEVIYSAGTDPTLLEEHEENE